MPTITIMALFCRLPDTTHDAFRDYYETRHVPLVRRLLPAFGDYRRFYVGDEATRSALGRDVVTIASFDTIEAFDAVQSAMADPEIAGLIAADEARFIDRGRSLTFATDMAH